MSSERREMNGTWLKGPEKPHACEKPNARMASAGSVWRCDCGVAWIVSSGDQREPGNYWKRSPGDDERPKA